MSWRRKGGESLLIASQTVEKTYNELPADQRGACALLLSALQRDFKQRMTVFRQRNPHAKLGDETSIRLCVAERMLSVPILNASVFNVAEMAEEAAAMHALIQQTDSVWRIYKHVNVHSSNGEYYLLSIVQAVVGLIAVAFIIVVAMYVFNPSLASRLLCESGYRWWCAH